MESHNGFPAHFEGDDTMGLLGWMKSPEELFKEGWTAYQAKDYAKALPLFEKSAEKGHDTAQYDAGYMYEHGEGTAVNYAKALMWHEKAAGQRYVAAQFNYGAITMAEVRLWIRQKPLCGTKKPRNRGTLRLNITVDGCTNTVRVQL